MIVGLLLAACGSSDDDPLPTLITVPEATAEVTVASEDESDPRAPASNTPRATITQAPPLPATNTFTPTLRPTRTPTLNPTQALESTATQNVIEVIALTPLFATLTPAPVIIELEAPVIAADVVITEIQFQEALNQQLATIPEISSARVNFVAGDAPGLRVEMTARGGEALTTGNVFFAFQLLQDIIAIQVVDISTGSGEPPQPFVDLALSQLNDAVFNSLDGLLTARLGAQHNLETIAFTETTIEMMLLVPVQ
ncbi:MAG: hypothetical protein OHK0046_32660 [Anaerolineae bacterium]